MAKIRHSDTAPSGNVRYSFAGAEFDLDGNKTFESDDPVILTNAESHPWLTVDYPKAEMVQGAYVEQIAPKDDPMSAMNSIANDPGEAKKAEEAKMEAFANPVAIEAGLDQKDKTEIIESPDSPPVAETVAAAKEEAKKN